MTKIGLISILTGAGVLGAIACSPTSPKLLPKPPVEVETVKTASNLVSFNPMVDILFVVDDSGSMSGHQNNLATNIDKFTQDIQKNQILDYHIGVITSTTSGSGAKCCGKLVGTTKYVDRNTVNGMRILAENLRVGISGDGTEKFFDPIRLALDNPLLTGDNKGFYRDDAHLVIVFITDAEDQGTIKGLELYNYLVKMKRGVKSKVLAYGAIVPTADTTGCNRDDSSTPVSIEEFLKLAQPDQGKDNFFSLCAGDFGAKLAGLGDDLAKRVGRTMLLDRPADPASIVVNYGNPNDPKAPKFLIPNDITKGWTYDPGSNAIVFGSEIDWTALPPGLKVEVTFNTAQID